MGHSGPKFVNAWPKHAELKKQGRRNVFLLVLKAPLYNLEHYTCFSLGAFCGKKRGQNKQINKLAYLSKYACIGTQIKRIGLIR